VVESVHTGERTLTAQGGNPNLFWDIETNSLVVIDHNLAFDTDFSAQNFVQSHVFHGQWHAMVRDNVYQEELRYKFASAMENWEAICSTVPSEWWLRGTKFCDFRVRRNNHGPWCTAVTRRRKNC
jgi:hypothetical protein